MTDQWFTVHDNLVTLIDHLVAEGASASEVADAVRKPWNYDDEFKAACRAR